MKNIETKVVIVGSEPGGATVAQELSHAGKAVENIGGHPGGTAAVGKVVDRDLAVKGVETLYVCDAGVFPRSPGRPPTLMILALASEFSRKLIAA